jgi:hypothetical protein
MSRHRFIRWFGKVAPSSALALWFLTSLVAKAEESWTRGIGGGTYSVADIKVEAFELNTVSKDGRTGRVSGTCIYDNRSPIVVALKGTETSDGDFYPSVTNQVGNDKNGHWKTVRRPTVDGKARTLAVPVKTSSKLLTVDLDAFVPMIGKFKYGRLLLENGESAIFELNYLRPPASAIK